ncbi:hypothetical protein BJF83_14860 [Nocardiopsis sp. CNR-923]|nr:hypothetical protein BJF83_14860 [Nocardiopsis sp. CNR-923]
MALIACTYCPRRFVGSGMWGAAPGLGGEPPGREGQPQEPEEQQLLLPQQEVEVQLELPLVAPVSGTATASRTLMTSMSSKSSSGRSIVGDSCMAIEHLLLE